MRLLGVVEHALYVAAARLLVCLALQLVWMSSTTTAAVSCCHHL